ERVLLRHHRPCYASGVVAREVRARAADNDRAAIEQGLVGVLPVRATHDVAILGLDVLAPDLVGIVDVRVAVEDREAFPDAVFVRHDPSDPTVPRARRSREADARRPRLLWPGR